MRKQALRIVTMLSLLLTLSAASIHAQSKTNRITIPFSFTVGHKILPAGEYTVRPNRQDSDNVWVIQSIRGGDSVLFGTNASWSINTPEKTQLVFNKYEDQYFLSQIWNAGANSGRQLKTPRSEAQLAKNGIKQERVVITLAAGE